MMKLGWGQEVSQFPPLIEEDHESAFGGHVADPRFLSASQTLKLCTGMLSHTHTCVVLHNSFRLIRRAENIFMHNEALSHLNN